MPFRWTVNPYRGCTHACVVLLRSSDPHATSTSTPVATSSARSSSRSTRQSCFAPSLHGRPGQREHVALGTNTDPYQWVEGRYKLMPGIWEALRERREPVLGADQVAAAAARPAADAGDRRRTDFSAALSVPTLDERAWRATEPHTPNPRARLEAVAELTRAGITTGVLVAPLMPGINDAPEQVARILELAAEAGAAYVTGIGLHLRGEVRGLFFEWLQTHRPDLISRYKALYRHGAYMPAQERRRLGRLVDGPDAERYRRIRGGSPETEPDPSRQTLPEPWQQTVPEPRQRVPELRLQAGRARQPTLF